MTINAESKRKAIEAAQARSDTPAIVLARPFEAANIGAAARAMANFGLHDLRVAAPVDDAWRSNAARLTAGAQPLLAGARAYESAAAATAGAHVVIAATARSRGSSRDLAHYDPTAAARAIVSATSRGLRTALLFGSERDGLSSVEMRSAHAVVTIDTDPQFSSLNLATSVAVLAHHWRREDVGAPVSTRRGELADEAQLEALFAYLETALAPSGFLARDDRPASMANLRRLLTRSAPTTGETKLLFGAFAALAEGAR